jgi:hypothetical protein
MNFAPQGAELIRLRRFVVKQNAAYDSITTIKERVMRKTQRFILMAAMGSAWLGKSLVQFLISDLSALNKREVIYLGRG